MAGFFQKIGETIGKITGSPDDGISGSENTSKIEEAVTGIVEKLKDPVDGISGNENTSEIEEAVTGIVEKLEDPVQVITGNPSDPITVDGKTVEGIVEEFKDRFTDQGRTGSEDGDDSSD